MANSADWRNLQQTHTNFKGGKRDEENPAKDRKFGNLQSNILTNEDPEKRPAAYSPDKMDKAAFGSSADWKT